MKSVALLDTTKTPQDPVHPAVARKMLRGGQAAVYRKHPFTIIRRAAPPPVGSQLSLFAPAPAPVTLASPLRLKIDPGSRTTGLAVVNDAEHEIIWAGEVKHRGAEIKKALLSRRALRRGRRNRNTRYRQPRFDNRPRGGCHGCGGNTAKGKHLCRPCAAQSRTVRGRVNHRWLPPSLMSRVYNTETWVRRLCGAFPIGAISVEVARFDTQQMENAEISGVEYQQGTLAGYEVREYLLEKWGRQCAYCRKKDIPLQIEHITPKIRGGSNRVTNLALACQPCNQRKGEQTAAEFGHPSVQAQARRPLPDAAMMNAARYAIRDLLEGFGLPLETGTGGQTKYNRTRAGMAKCHWADAACVGASTAEVWRVPAGEVQEIRAKSYARRGRRQTCLTDKNGFPAQAYGRPIEAKRGVRFFGYQTGDVVKVVKGKGKWAGAYRGRISVRASGTFVFSPRNKKTQPPSFRAGEIVGVLDRCGSYEYSARMIAGQCPSDADT